LSAEQLVLSIVQFGVDVGAHILLLLGDTLDLLVQLCLRPASSWRRQSYASVVLTTVRNVSPTNLQTDVGLLAVPADMPSVLYERFETRVPSGERGWEANAVLEVMQIKKLRRGQHAGACRFGVPWRGYQKGCRFPALKSPYFSTAE
jgi:hypothetical protein